MPLEQTIRPDAVRALALGVLILLVTQGCADDPADRPPVQGTIGSLSLSIPDADVFIVDYDDITAPTGTPRTCRSEIDGMVIFRRWPGLSPITPELKDEFKRTYWSSLNESQWIDIGLHERSPAGDDPEVVLWRYRGIKFDEIMPEPRRRVRVVHDTEELLPGLSSARTIGEPIVRFTGDRRPSPDEYRIYWAPGSGEGRIRTLISCTAGDWMVAAGTVPKCEQEFFMDRFQVYAAVRYRGNLLPEWAEIEKAVESHLASYRRECGPGGEG